MATFKKCVVTGDLRVEVAIDAGSIWLTIRDVYGDRSYGETSCSNESAVGIATMLLNAVQKQQHASD